MAAQSEITQAGQGIDLMDIIFKIVKYITVHEGLLWHENMGIPKGF